MHITIIVLFTLDVLDESADDEKPERVDGVHDQFIASAHREADAISRVVLYKGIIYVYGPFKSPYT